MDLAFCKGLLGHAEWADALVWKAVSALGREDGELRETLHHLHLVQWTYLRIWRGEPVRVRELAVFPTNGAVRAWAREYYRELPAHLAGLCETDLGRLLRFPWADQLVQRLGKAAPVTWSDSVVQIAMHTAYHRGQAARRLRELGGEPPLTDYVAWLWLGRPVADWGAEEAA